MAKSLTIKARKYIAERYGFIYKRTGPKVCDETLEIVGGFAPIPSIEMALYSALEAETIQRLQIAERAKD